MGSLELNCSSGGLKNWILPLNVQLKAVIQYPDRSSHPPGLLFPKEISFSRVLGEELHLLVQNKKKNLSQIFFRELSPKPS